MDRDAFRPQIHFSPEQGWMNDPNGMVYFDGLYHLFYQHHPHSDDWGPMHWGHAISTDLVQWEHRPVALAPDELGCIWSGSAVFDRHNSSGLGESGQGPLVAIFTYHLEAREETGLRSHQTQGLAYSNDGGLSWQKYSGNPVLANPERVPDFRDPKVFWHEDSARWIMVLAAGDEAQFWSSINLLEWQYLSSFGAGYGAHGGVWECPDLVRLQIEGSAEVRWILIQSLNPGGPQQGSGTQYFVGDFDGKRFELADPVHQGVRWVDQGPDCYAGVTWSNVPAMDGRMLFIGWLGNWEYADKVPTSPWRGVMCIPRRLNLRQTTSGMVLCSWPVEELADRRELELANCSTKVSAGSEVVAVECRVLSPIDVLFQVRLPENGQVELRFSNAQGEEYVFGYDVDRQAAYSDRGAAGLSDFSPVQFPRRHWIDHKTRVLDLRLLMDRCSAEVFLNQGEVAFTTMLFPSEHYSSLKVFSSQRDVAFNLLAYQLSTEPNASHF